MMLEVNLLVTRRYIRTLYYLTNTVVEKENPSGDAELLYLAQGVLADQGRLARQGGVCDGGEALHRSPNGSWNGEK